MHYGIENVKGDKFRKVKLEQEYRKGLMGKGADNIIGLHPADTQQRKTHGLDDFVQRFDLAA